MKLMTTRIILATRNRHKLQEFRDMLQGLDIEILSCNAFAGCPDVVEDGATFADNALKKARAIARHTGHVTLADDSGLEVDALGGLPGLYSARFAGEPADDCRNNEKLLRELARVPDEKRGAQFRCVIAMVDSRGREKVVEGIYRGVIIRELKGVQGFGYDPLFVDTVSGLTFAEMAAEHKNSISHRCRAIQELKKILPEFIA
jgi:XTP/dITP diphosphohydrolase